MKKVKFTLLLVLTVISFVPVTETKAQSVSISFSTFQQQLSPYGKWMHNPRFGEVWIYNDAGFKPYYSNGHWEYTNYGWSWESDYDWGWAPFHYGRWEYDPYYGWMWIPGYEWASAWVSWSSYEDYYGWAPLGYGININVSFGAIPFNNWNFIPRRNICDRNLNRYYISNQRNDRFRHAVIINNYYNGNGDIGNYVRGPERREVERYTNSRIQERRIHYNDRNRNRNDNRNNNDYGRISRRNNVDENRNDNNARTPDNRRRREINSDNNSTSPGYENRRPQREVNSSPQINRNTNPVSRQDENRNDRKNEQQKRPERQQQNQPVMEQRQIQRRVESDNGRNRQQGDNNQRRNSNTGFKKDTN